MMMFSSTSSSSLESDFASSFVTYSRLGLVAFDVESAKLPTIAGTTNSSTGHTSPDISSSIDTSILACGTDIAASSMKM